MRAVRNRKESDTGLVRKSSPRFAMASSYNARPRPAEVMVDGDAVHEVRARETVADLMRGEQRLPFA